MTNRGTHRYDARDVRYHDGEQASEPYDDGHPEEASYQERLGSLSDYRYYPSKHVQQHKVQSRAHSAYQKTREDVQAHSQLHSGAERYASSSPRYHPHASRQGDERARRASTARHARGHHNARKPVAKRSGRLLKLIGAAAFLAVAVVAVLQLHPFGIGISRPQAQDDPATLGMTTSDTPASSSEDEWLPTPYIAESNGVKLHCAVKVEDLTEILIHNASYAYAEALTTELVEATNTDVMAAGGTGRVASEQPTGDNWLTGEFIRTYRSGNAGAKLSAIDCGAAVGTQVYAPVTGTVQLVRAYKLYDNQAYDDYEIHIQPDGHPELDVVLIHLTDPGVERGSRVEGGVTPIAKIRDVYAYVGESMQLKRYTAQGDNGNHTHIQVNNAESSEYHGLDEDRIAKSVPLQD